MSIVPLVLRMLLAVALVLGGAGGAVAEVRMQLQHAGEGSVNEAVDSPARLHAAMPDCHEIADSAGSAAPAGHDDSGPMDAQADCCADQTCGCTCAQPGSVAVSVAFPGSALPPGSSTMPWPVAGHAAPLLLGLTRPPIA